MYAVYWTGNRRFYPPFRYQESRCQSHCAITIQAHPTCEKRDKLEYKTIVDVVVLDKLFHSSVQ